MPWSFVENYVSDTYESRMEEIVAGYMNSPTSDPLLKLFVQRSLQFIDQQYKIN